MLREQILQNHKKEGKNKDLFSLIILPLMG